METSQETTQPAAAEAGAAPPSTPTPSAAPPSAPAPGNPFKEQIEQARKEWEGIGKPQPEEAKGDPKPDGAAGNGKKPEADKSGFRKIIDAKDAAIKNAKSETARLQERLKTVESEYGKALADKDDAAALKALSKAELLGEEISNAAAKGAQEDFFRNAESENTVLDMDQFRANAEYYIPILCSNPAIERLLLAQKYPFAAMELLFGTMADKGWSAEKLAATPEPTLRLWLGAVGSEAAARVEGASAPPPPSAPKPPVPASVVATTGGDLGSEPAIKANGASMEDIIRHVRKYGGNGIG